MIIKNAVTPKKSYAEILKNSKPKEAKPKEIVKVVNIESPQKSPNRVTSTEVGVFPIEAASITMFRNQI